MHGTTLNKIIYNNFNYGGGKYNLQFDIQRWFGTKRYYSATFVTIEQTIKTEKNISK